jgi:hypothetical protein
MGTVSAISGNTITVQSKGFNRGSTNGTGTATTTTYTVDASAATVTKDNAASSVGSIATGDTVMVEGTVSGTNVAAKTIHDGAMPMMQRPAASGKVTAVSGSTITISSQGFGKTATATTYTVNASGATVTKNNATSSVSAIAVGDMIQVQGTVSGSTVTATSIRDDVAPTPVIQGDGKPVVGGKVATISGNTLTITNQSGTFTVDASQAKIAVGNTVSTISSISVGDNVVVQGTVSGNSVTATSVMDQKAPSTSGTSGMKGPAGGFMQGIGGMLSNIFGFFSKL